MRRIYLILAVASLTAAASAKAPRPNIVFIIADDMGYSDLGCYGGEIQTPSLDRLASNGLRFTHYYTENMCAPTRATLLTGQYQLRGFNSGRNVTIAEALAGGDYLSCMSGKWHNTNDTAGGLLAPLKRGFDKFYGTPIGCGSFFAPLKLSRDGKNAEDEWKRPDFFYTDAITDNAIDYVEGTPDETPIFLYVAYTAAHWPLHALPEDIAKYKGKYAMGWDRLRNQRLARMKELGVIEPHAELSPRNPNVPAWKDEEHKAWQERRMEVYAAQVDRMDQGIGRLIETLKASGRFDNTLLMFTLDNGGCHVEYGPTRKGEFLNKTTRDGRPMRVGNLPEIMPGPEDTWQSYGHGWANASNTPFRLFKQHSHEGGVRVPLIVHWPETIKQGGITDQVAHVMDVLPTILDATDVPYPAKRDGKTVLPADGKSMLPIFRGEQREGHDALFFQHARGKAVRQGDWKLVQVGKTPWELYNLKADPIEVNDLAEAQPERVAALARLWDAWKAEVTAPKVKKGKK